MPRKKLYGSEQVKLMRILKARLIEISLKVDNYIYKQKPITELQAKAFLDEISSYKSQCQNDIGYLQVIEKLTKYMNIIISKNTNKTPVNEVNSNNEISNNTTLTSTSENLLTTNDIVSASINRDTLKLSLYNESTSSAETISRDNYESNKKCYNEVEKRSIVKETVDLEKGETKQKTKKEKAKKTNISSKVVGNGARDESNVTNIPHTASMERDSGEHKGDDTLSTNNDQTLRIEKRIQSSLKNDYRLLICVDGGVINEINHLSNTTVIYQAPEVNIPLNEFALNNTKMPNFLSKFHPKVIQNNLTIKSGEGPKHVPVIHKPRVRKINNNKVKFSAPYIDLTENARPDKNKLDEENNKKILASNLTASNSEKNMLSKKQRSIKKDATKTKKGNKMKESRRINNKKSQNQAIKRKVNECKSVDQSILPKDVKSSSNNLKAQNDLSWFDSIKYVRKIDEQEYFKPLQPLDDNFWHTPSLLSDDKEFNI